MFQRNFSDAGIELFCGERRVKFDVAAAGDGERAEKTIGENDTVYHVISQYRR